MISTRHGNGKTNVSKSIQAFDMMKSTTTLVLAAIIGVIMTTSVVSGETSVSVEAKPGGFFPVEDLQDPRLLTAVEFAMEQLQDESSVTTVRDYDFYPLPIGTSYEPRIIGAMQKVVAGTLWKVAIAIETSDNGECVGALEVTVFDSFGTLSVQSWGSELTCQGDVKYPEEEEEQTNQSPGNSGQVTNNNNVGEIANSQKSSGNSKNQTSSITLFVAWMCFISRFLL